MASRLQTRGSQDVMSDATTNATQPKVSEFHVMGVRLARPRMTLENRETLLQGRRIFRGMDPGFPPMPEIPRYVIHGPPRDMEKEEFYWIVSARMRAVLKRWIARLSPS